MSWGPTAGVMLALLGATSALAGGGVVVPVDVGVGPAASWYFGRLLENRGAIPHFGLHINVHAVVDQELIEANWDRVPHRYRGMASKVSEVRISPSIFIPSALIISPKVGPLGGTGMYGVSWTPIGLTLVSTGRKSTHDWNPSRGRFFLTANALLTYLFIHSDFDALPTTHFFRPGIELRADLLLTIGTALLVSLGGGAQAYLPQRLGSFFEVTPFDETLWLSWFAFLKFHLRFPYEMRL